MEKKVFESRMIQADTFKKVSDKPEYYSGYMRGLRRLFHGEAFGTDAEHALWSGLVDDSDEAREQRGQGYRDGFNGLTPNPDRWERAGGRHKRGPGKDPALYRK